MCVKNQSLRLHSPIKILCEMIFACFVFLQNCKGSCNIGVPRVSCFESALDSVISLVEALTGFSYGRGTSCMSTVFQASGTTCSIGIFSRKRSKCGPTFQLLSSSSIVFLMTSFFFPPCTGGVLSHSSGGECSSIPAEDVICYRHQ